MLGHMSLVLQLHIGGVSVAPVLSLWHQRLPSLSAEAAAISTANIIARIGPGTTEFAATLAALVSVMKLMFTLVGQPCSSKAG